MSSPTEIRLNELNLDMINPPYDKIFDSEQGAHKTVVIGKPGCFSPGTKVMMYDGTLKNVEDVVVGDMVMGDDSTCRNVFGVCAGEEHMYEVCPDHGESYTVNERHKLVLVSRGCKTHKKGEIIEIKVGDFLSKPPGFQSRWEIFRNCVDFPEREVEIDPYLIGLCLTDKQRIFKHLIGFYLCDTIDQDLLKEHVRDSYLDKELYDRCVKFWTDNLLNEKLCIPLEYKVNSRRNRLKLLAGLLDSDSYYDMNKKVYEITQSQKSFVDDIVFLCRTLGLSVELKEMINTYIDHGSESQQDFYYRISISGDLAGIPCLIRGIPWQAPTKKPYENLPCKNKLSSTFSLKKQGIGQYYGFTLDGNHRFLLGTCDVVRNTGKTTLIASLLYWKKHIFPIAMAMSGSEDSNHFYRTILPSTFVYNSYDEEKIKDFIRRQKIAKQHLQYPWGVMLLDDCTDDIKVFNKPVQHALYKKGRHWKMWYILSLQYAMDVKPVIRVNVDGCFILRESSPKIRKIIWENYAGIIPDFSLFCKILDCCTDDYTALYIHNATQTNNWQDCVFWYKANPDDIPPDFRFGCDDYWKFHYQRYNPEYVDPLDAE